MWHTYNLLRAKHERSKTRIKCFVLMQQSCHCMAKATPLRAPHESSRADIGIFDAIKQSLNCESMIRINHRLHLMDKPLAELYSIDFI